MNTKRIKRFVILGIFVVIALFGLIYYMSAFVNIKAGYVGYMYDRTLKPGDTRAIPGTSVIDQKLYGRVGINPFTQELYIYPTTIVSRSWTSNTEGKADKNEAFPVGTKEGQNVTADVYLSVQPEDVGLIIRNWGGKDFDAIVDNELLGLTKGFLSGVTQTYSVYDVQAQRTEIQDEVFKRLGEVLQKTYGIKLVRFQLGNVVPPAEIQTKINQKTEAVNAVALAQLDRQKQDELNKKVVDQQKAESEKDLVKRQNDANAAAYEIEKQAEAKKQSAQALYDAAVLEKKAELEKQQTYTESYLKNKALDIQLEAVQKLNPDLKIIVTDKDGSGLSAIPGIQAILDELRASAAK